jgi:ribonuclease HI
MQVNATTRQKEKLATTLFEKKVALDRIGIDDEGVHTHLMIPFDKRYRKPKSESLKERQLLFPGAPPPDRRARMPIETRKRWGGEDYHQTRLVEDVASGEKITPIYDTTQRMTQVDADVEAEITGSDRVVPGDAFKRTITWVWPNSTTTIINKILVPVRATPQDLLWRICRALKVPELDSTFTVITPEDWRHARAIRVEFAYERPPLSNMKVVSEKVFNDEYDERLPIFIETDGACAGNDNKESPGGWGAIICQGNRMLQRWGNKPDTSNNEMEYQAIFEALQFTHPKAFIMIETDSQGCLDGLTKYRLRWEKNGWNRGDGQPVENADLIRTICPLIDARHVGFWKIKGHSKDPWNDLADSLAVRGRNVQSKMVVVQIYFRAIIEGKETFQAIPRIQSARTRIFMTSGPP